MKRLFLEDEELRNHNYIIICYNFMLSLLKRANRKDWHSMIINVKKEDEEEWQKHDVEYWRLHGYKEEISKFYFQHTFFSLLADYLDYTFEATIASYKMKASIAYSLLRKPLKDDLLFIEILKVKGIEFIYEFLEKPIEKFAVDKINNEQIKQIICTAAKEVFSETHGELLYDLRYSKKSEIRIRKNME